MQIELLNRKKWRSKIELSIATAQWIEPFYNPEHLHKLVGLRPSRRIRRPTRSNRSIHPDLTLTTVVRKMGVGHCADIHPLPSTHGDAAVG